VVECITAHRKPPKVDILPGIHAGEDVHLLSFLCAVQLRLTKPQRQHVLRLADALIVSETRHKTIASLYRMIVEAPDPSNGADSLRISPWTADDLRAPLRHFIVTDVVAYAQDASR
jgi:hypothetical protein